MAVLKKDFINYSKWKLNKISILFLCLLLLNILPIFLIIKNINEELLSLVIIYLILTTPPFIISFIIRILFKLKFYKSLLISTLLEIIILYSLIIYSIVYSTDNNTNPLKVSNNQSIDAYKGTYDYFEKKAGFFQSYKFIYMKDDIVTFHCHQMYYTKILYYIGREKIKNAYFGKILVDSTNVLVKEVYNTRVLDDTILFEKEFGTSYRDNIFLKMKP